MTSTHRAVRWLHGLVDLRGHELPAVLWAGAMFFAALASYFVLRPVRDALVLDGDIAFIPVLFTATFVSMLLVAPAWGALVARWPRQRFVPFVYHFFVVNLVILYALVRAEVAPALVGRVFYVWSSVFNFFVVSVFWSLLADGFRADQARRLYGPIAIGGTLGTIVGPVLTRTLVEWIGVHGILLAAAVLLELAILCSRRLDRAMTRMAEVETAAAPADDGADCDAREPVRGHPLSGLTRVARSPYLAGIAVYVVCISVAATFVYLEQAALVQALLPDRSARTLFFSELDLWIAIATLAVQSLLASRLLRWLGVGVVLAIRPLVQGAGLTALVVAPSLAVVAAVQIAARSTTHGLARPARELLFTVVAREDKYRAKNVIDTLIYRAGDVGSSWVHRGLVAAGLGGASLVAAAAPLTVVWLIASILLGIAFRRRAAAALARSPS